MDQHEKKAGEVAIRDIVLLALVHGPWSGTELFFWLQAKFPGIFHCTGCLNSALVNITGEELIEIDHDHLLRLSKKGELHLRGHELLRFIARLYAMLEEPEQDPKLMLTLV